VKFRVLIHLCLFLIASISYGDIDKQHSLDKYPEITHLINDGEEDERCFSSVNFNLDNDGIKSFSRKENHEYLLVNYIYDCHNRIESYSSVIEIRNGVYLLSSIQIPDINEITIKGEKYSLHFPESDINQEELIISYAFACKNHAKFMRVGGCSEGTTYEAQLNFKFKNSAFELVTKNVQVKI
jgi:hypothetical protein